MLVPSAVKAEMVGREERSGSAVPLTADRRGLRLCSVRGAAAEEGEEVGGREG